MKSTKYQFLKDDFDHACEQLRINKKVIEELRTENEKLRKYIHRIDPVGFITNKFNK